MNPHPATVEYIRSACRRPGMYMLDYDLCDLEKQLHGFDAALKAVDALGAHDAFNRAFAAFISDKTGLSGCQGWAVALADGFGAGRPAFDAFCGLLSDALPAQFNPGTFVHE